MLLNIPLTYQQFTMDMTLNILERDDFEGLNFYETACAKVYKFYFHYNF